MRERCVEMTLQGRCPQVRVENSVKLADLAPTRCYYHDKVYHGYTTSADTIVPLDDDDDF